MTMEILATVLGALGIADIVRIIVVKVFSKKKDQVATAKDEFEAIRERLSYNEKETNRLNKAQIAANRKISRLYSYLVGVTTKTCTKKNCALREILAIDFDDFDDDDDEPVNEKPALPVEKLTITTDKINEYEPKQTV